MKKWPTYAESVKDFFAGYVSGSTLIIYGDEHPTYELVRLKLKAHPSYPNNLRAFQGRDRCCAAGKPSRFEIRNSSGRICCGTVGTTSASTLHLKELWPGGLIRDADDLTVDFHVD